MTSALNVWFIVGAKALSELSPNQSLDQEPKYVPEKPQSKAATEIENGKSLK
jgi:hypothetical protein